MISYGQSLLETVEKSFQKVKAMAQRDGAEAELLVEMGDSLNLSVDDGKLEKFDVSQSQVGGLRVVLNGIEGYCWTESLEDSDLELAYKEALANAKFASQGRSEKEMKDDFVSLYSGASAKEDETLFSSSADAISIDEKIDRAKALERETKAVDPRIKSVPYNSYREVRGASIVLNTKGVRAVQRSSGVAGYSYCLAKSGEAGTEESRMAGDSFFTRDAASVNLQKTARTAAEKALLKLGAVSPETGNYPILIDREVVSELFGLISDYFSAKSVAEKTSIFSEDRGKSIASSVITVVDDPFYKNGVGNRSFDSEGAPTQRTILIENGSLKSFMTNSVYAKKLNLPHTANASRSAKGSLGIGYSNLIVQPGKDSFEQLKKRHPKLIYVTDFSGYHAGFREGSGEFSLQAEGELWENGQRSKALCNFVVSGSVRELLSNVEAVSNRLTEITGSVIAPDILVKSLSVAG